MFDLLHRPRPHYKSVIRGKEWLARLMEMLQNQVIDQNHLKFIELKFMGYIQNITCMERMG